MQYSWGLDNDHDIYSGAVDKNLQQATVNLFADMGVQPTTLMKGLVAATMSTDHIAPTSVITSPVAGATIAAGSPITIKGTARPGGRRCRGCRSLGRRWPDLASRHRHDELELHVHSAQLGSVHGFKPRHRR